jgi:hypothetical protein
LPSSAPLLPLHTPPVSSNISSFGELHWQRGAAQPLELVPNGNGARGRGSGAAASFSCGAARGLGRPGERPDPGAPGPAAQRGVLAVRRLRHRQPGAGARALLLARGGGAGCRAHSAARPLAQRRARVLVGRLRRVRGGRPVPHPARLPHAVPQPQFLEQGCVFLS